MMMMMMMMMLMNLDISCMGKWVTREDTRGAYSIFHIKFDRKVKYFAVKFVLEPVNRSHISCLVGKYTSR